MNTQNKEIRYLEATLNGSSIYIKLPFETVMLILDTFIDGGYTVTKSDKETWECNTQYSKSYYVNSIEEAKQFQQNQLKFIK